MSHRSNRTVALTTLGCKVNQADSDEWLRQFVAHGYEVVDFESTADAYVVNTCTVTHIADRKSRHLLRQARRRNPAALVIATGCYASVAPADLARMAEVDLVIGDQEKPRLVSIVHDYLEGDDEQPLESLAGELRRFGPRHRGFVKIADGCDKFCAFCIVPYARGRARSVLPDLVIQRVSQFANEGHHEVVLTAVHMGTYGRDLSSPTSLRELTKRVLDETEVSRLRLSSIEPEDFDAAILGLWSDSRLCRHFHLALDSGCDATLIRMRRRYSRAEYHDIVRSIREAIPNVAITTDVIVGFPGETEDEFEASAAFVGSLEFAAVHIFPYSIRHRTAASKLPNQIDPETKQRRMDRMLAIGVQSSIAFRRRFVGTEAAVLYEGQPNRLSEEQTWDGLTDNYLKVRTKSRLNLSNQLITSEITDLVDGQLLGTVVGEPSRLSHVTSEAPVSTLPALTSASR